MGFFDRVKKAFGVKPKEEETKEQATQNAEEPQVEEQTAESVATPETDTNEAATESAAESTAETTPAEPDVAPSVETNEKVESAVEPQVEEAPAADSDEKENEQPEEVEQSSLTSQTAATDSQSDLKVNTETVSAEETTQEAEAVVQPTTDIKSAATEPVEESVEIEPEAKSEEPEQTLEAPEDAVTPSETSIAEDTTDEEDVTEAPETPQDSITEYDQGLAKSRHGFVARLNKFLANFRSVDEDFFEDLEEMLIEADVGFETAMEISNQLRDEVKLQNAKTKKQIGQVIVEKMVDIYGEAGENEDNSLHFTTNPNEPTIFLFVGVNGAGKTTTIGKLATKYHNEGKKVLLAAGDTFRAGAIEQLAEWARRAQVDVVTSKPGTDPASVVFDAVKKAKAEQYDILLVDTAGRLQNNVNLMNELAKIKRIIVRELPDAPQEVLLVLDASTGQNALNQAKQFSKTTDVTGLILTKLDGSSKGGIIIAIRNELHLPVKLVGLGEKAQDLQIFEAEKYVYGLFKDLIED